MADLKGKFYPTLSCWFCIRRTSKQPPNTAYQFAPGSPCLNTETNNFMILNVCRDIKAKHIEKSKHNKTYNIHCVYNATPNILPQNHTLSNTNIGLDKYAMY